MRNACDKKIEHKSKVKVKVTENTKTTISAITFEPEVVETTGWFKNVPYQNTYQQCRGQNLLRLLCLKFKYCNIFGFHGIIGVFIKTVFNEYYAFWIF